MPVTYSPLRYPGGKTQLSSFVERLIRENQLSGGTYVEPFAGGAGIAWYLLRNNVVRTVAINDISKPIFAFWSSVLNHPCELCELIENTSVTIEQWYLQKKVQEQNSPSILELGYSTLFLNRVNRSGILRAGVIGGKEQSGKYKLDCRFKKPVLIDKIKQITAYKNRIILTNMDGSDFLRRYDESFEDKTLINIDPPYYNKGKELYENFFVHADHEVLFETITQLKRPWIVTYDHVSAIAKMYKAYRPRYFSLNYSAQTKRRGQEIIALSPVLRELNSLEQLTA